MVRVSTHKGNLTAHVFVLLCIFLLIGLHGCSRLLTIQYSADRVLHGSLSGHPIDHVVIFAIDGLEHGTLVKYLTQNPPRKPGGLHDLLGVRVNASGLSLTKGVPSNNRRRCSLPTPMQPEPRC